MKKILFISLLIITSFSAFAFSFDILAKTPLYSESLSDPYSFKSSINVLFATDNDKRPNKVYSTIFERQNNTDNYRVFYDFIDYEDIPQEEQNNKYVNMKLGTSLGLGRFRFEEVPFFRTIDAELNAAGYINTIFNLFGKNDVLDFDGSFQFGATARFDDLFSVRVGIHHFSGHYGDEMLEKYYRWNKVDTSDTFNEAAAFDYAKAENGFSYYMGDPVEYVRDNSLIFAMSADVPHNKLSLRAYAEAELPMNPSWIRPVAHCPADYKNPVKEERPTLIDRIGGDSYDGEHFAQNQLNQEQDLKRTAKGTYKAWRIHTGAEIKYSLSFGSIFCSADIQFHQDGQTLHKVGGYNKTNPWEKELTAALGLELGNAVQNHCLRFQAAYHSGRVPATQWFYQRMNYVSVGFSLD